MKTLSQGAKGPGREFLQFSRSSLLTGELGTRGRTDRVHEDTWICNSTIGTCTLSEPLFMSPVPHLHCFLLQEEYYITPPQNLLQGGASQTTLTLLLTLTTTAVKMEKTLWVFSSTQLCFHQVNGGSSSSGFGLLFLLFYFILFYYFNSLFIIQY